MNNQDLMAENWTDESGNPAGGVASGTGFAISWQNGPLGRGEDRREPNGAFVETIIKAAMQRIEFYQGTRFKCEENREAIYHLDMALAELSSRTSRRESQNTEGTHSGN